jgi:hypothetical protein
MLRSKKFNVYKHTGLNYLFDYCKDDRKEFSIDFNDIDKDIYISDIVSKSISNYISLIPSTRHSNLIYYT